MRLLLFATLLVLAAALFAGPQADAALKAINEHLTQKMGGKWTWVFYGDSITHGCAHTAGWRNFVEIFEERVRYESGLPYDAIINTGISGESSVELVNAKSYDWRVRRFKPNVVLILIGSNDIVRNYTGTIHDFKQRMEQLVELVRADGAIPVLQTYPTILYVNDPPNEYYRGYVKRFEEFPAYNNVIRDVAAEKDTILIDHEKHWLENANDFDTLNFWQGEVIHPGGKGHQEMAIAIFKALGAYAPNSKCLTLPAGGEPPEEVLKAAEQRQKK